VLQWEPELRFYEHRIAILRALQDRDELHAFYVSDEAVRGRLTNDDRELVVARDRLDISFRSPEAEAENGWDAVRLALSLIRPARPIGCQVYLQHVIPLNLDFDAAVDAGYRRLFSVPPVEGVQFGDWAFLSDLVSADGTESHAGIEFGIVRREEVPDRLERRVGRAGRVGGGGGYAPNVDLATFADVSLFADSWWSSIYATKTPFVESALQFWYTSRERADGVVDAVYVALNHEDEQKGLRTA
jgi:hypothetical protein